MGLLSGIVGLFTGSDKALDKGLDLANRAADGVDAMFYTDEEKTATKMQWAQMAMEFTKNSLTESMPRSLSRRYLAWGIMSLAAFLTLYALLMKTIGAFWASMTAAFDSAAGFSMSLLKLWWPIVLAIGVFYFGAHLLKMRSSK